MKVKPILFILIAAISLILSSCYSWDDGPFPGQSLSESSTPGDPDYALEYKGGVLSVYNRSEEEFPLLVYKQPGKTGWAVEMRTDIEEYENTLFWAIEDPVLKKGGLFYDELDFTGHWTYGAEAGRARLTPRRFLKFYLSW